MTATPPDRSDEDPYLEGADEVMFDLTTAEAEKECPEYDHDPTIEAGYGEQCPTPRKFPFCQYCAWQEDPLDRMWMQARTQRILDEGRRKGLI